MELNGISQLLDNEGIRDRIIGPPHEDKDVLKDTLSRGFRV